jgi:hypothetical protein
LIIALILVVVAGCAAILLRRPGSRVPRRSLSTSERVYLILALAPVLLTLGIPSLIVFTVGIGPAAREWSNRLSNSGLWLSLGLTVVGSYLLWRNRHQASGPSPWLLIAVAVAAVPIALAVLLIAMWRLASVTVKSFGG